MYCFHRALLQLSALSQRTYDCTNVLISLLTQLSNTLQGIHTHPGRDHTLLQWLVLLLSHILSSLTLKTTSKSHPNLFQPLPLMMAPPPDNSLAWERSRAAVKEIHDKKMTIRLQLSRLRTEIRSATGEEKVKLIAESEALKKVSGLSYMFIACTYDWSHDLYITCICVSYMCTCSSVTTCTSQISNLPFLLLYKNLVTSCTDIHVVKLKVCTSFTSALYNAQNYCLR